MFPTGNVMRGDVEINAANVSKSNVPRRRKYVTFSLHISANVPMEVVHSLVNRPHFSSQRFGLRRHQTPANQGLGKRLQARRRISIRSVQDMPPYILPILLILPFEVRSVATATPQRSQA
jgi:hypothetical protein